MVLFRRLLGEVLRRHRQRQGRTLRDVAGAARVSLGYLSEVERGVKEASSELLTAVCDALGVSLADVLREISEDLVALERRPLQSVGFATSGRAGGRVAARPVAGVAPLVASRGAAASTSGPMSSNGSVPSRRGAPAAVNDDADDSIAPVASVTPVGPVSPVASVTSLSGRRLPVVAA